MEHPAMSSPLGVLSVICRSKPSIGDSGYESAGFAQNAIYLLRPDTYVAFADASDRPRGLSEFCADKQIQLRTPLVREFERESII